MQLNIEQVMFGQFESWRFTTPCRFHLSKDMQYITTWKISIEFETMILYMDFAFQGNRSSTKLFAQTRTGNVIIGSEKEIK